ncbi:hypothetical protein BGW80DRAFT_1303027 [Lactifluus volemus]|nr:hypothetical protein BGW80DRAFT_1303027 [Lactifluus volemus]
MLKATDPPKCTDTEGPEYASLVSVHTPVSKITTSLDASLYDARAQTLALLAPIRPF